MKIHTIGDQDSTEPLSDFDKALNITMPECQILKHIHNLKDAHTSLQLTHDLVESTKFDTSREPSSSINRLKTALLGMIKDPEKSEITISELSQHLRSILRAVIPYSQELA